MTAENSETGALKQRFFELSSLKSLLILRRANFQKLKRNNKIVIKLLKFITHLKKSLHKHKQLFRFFGCLHTNFAPAFKACSK
jgi:hypothetical protein